MGAAAAEVDLGPLVDHHCHGLLLDDLDRPRFEALMNEAQRPPRPGTTRFDSMLGLAVRRWCAPVLDLAPLTPAGDYLQRRRELGGAEVARRLVAAAGIDTFLVDTGLDATRLCSPADLAAMTSRPGGTAHEVVRLERVAEEVLAADVPAAGFADAVVARLRASGAVAAKSIAAYRTGLRLPAAPPSPGTLTSAVAALATAPARARVADPVVGGWLAWTAVELGLPLQLHVGYGDRDLDLREADPLLLTEFLRATEDREVPVLLLHTYPFHRQAAYLCQVFDHVHMDLGLATHNTGALAARVLREALELVPFDRLLFSTDAYGLAEHYLLGALLFRRALSGVLGGLVADGDLGADDAARVAALVARDNARRVYRLG